MNETVKQLEERVTQAVKRIRDLSEERRRLHAELDDLRDRLEALESNDRDLSADQSETAEVWRGQQAQIVAALKSAVHALREEDASPHI